MAAPFVMTVLHRLGRQKAKTRLQNGFGQIRQVFPGLDEQWTGDQMEFRVPALGQIVTGRIEVHLPGMLG